MSQSAEQIRSKMESLLSKMNGDSAFEQALRTNASNTLSELGFNPESLADGGNHANAGGDCAGLLSCLLLTSISQ